MLRKQARLRREYIYRKSIEYRQKAIQERKNKVKGALEEGHQIPTDLQNDAIAIQDTLGWEDEGGEGVVNHADDEYRMAGVEDPRIVVTTSRDPSAKLKQFVKEVRLLLPNSKRINRGSFELKQLMAACQRNSVTDLVMVQEHRGVPDGLIISHLPFGPTAYFQIMNTVMRHDIPEGLKTVSEAYPQLIFDNFPSKLGQRISNILKYLFPVPKPEGQRVITFANNEDIISVRHHTFTKVRNEVELTEVGPRFELKLFKIILGTLENADYADVEWQFKPYMNTTKKRKFFSE